MSIKCKYCGSESVYFSKKRNIYVCEDCEETFEIEETIVPQKVFLSYGHDENEEVVRLIEQRLKERGHDPWVDKSQIKSGQDWRNKITEGITNSSDFLAFISKHSTRDPGVCLDEISIGISNYNIRIIPVRLEKDVTPPNSISNIQWIDLTDWKHFKYETTPQEWEQYFEEKIQEIIKVIEDENNILTRGRITELLERLHPITCALKMRMILKNEIVPRKWLFDKLSSWYLNKNAKEAIFVFGHPGVGKSIISAYASNYLPMCAASYFCEWNNTMSKNPKELLKSVIFQLSCALTDYQELLLKALKQYDIDVMNEDEIIDHFILNILNRLVDGNREEKLVAIDALDEALDSKNFINVVDKLIKNTPKWIKFIITSRPETKIKEKFISYDSLMIDDYKEEIREDVHEYVSKSIEDKVIVEQITDKSNGSFIYAKELIELYKSKPKSFDITKIPSGLGGVYYSNFERLFEDTHEYKNVYAKFFEVLLFAKEQLDIKELKDILNIDSDTLKTILTKLSSYIIPLKSNDKTFLEVYHKSLWDWLTTNDAGVYQINKEDGNTIYKSYILSFLEKQEPVSVYVSKYAFEHISRVEFENLTRDDSLRLLVKLSEGAKQYGNLVMEKYYLDYLKEYFENSIEYKCAALEYYKKTDGNKLLEFVDEVLKDVDQIKNEDDRFKLVSQIGFSYFYAGYSRKSYNLMKNKRKTFSDEFFLNEINDAIYWHVIALSAHDLDKNDDVIEAAKIDLAKYKANKKYYEQYVTMVNLFDGYMAYGDLKSADEIALKVLDYSDNRYFIHADDIIKLCYANLLQTEGKIMESLVYYEEGLLLAKKIQYWDYLYGSIWRELAIAKFGDHTALNNLLRYRESSIEMGYQYLISLADTFYILSSYILKDINKDKMKELYDEVIRLDLPGHILQSSLTMMLLNIIPIDNYLIAYNLKRSKGVKGYPEIVKIFFEERKEEVDEFAINRFIPWIEEHVNPILKYQEEAVKENTKDLPKEPYLAKSICPKCQAKCCYDGIYIEEHEEKLIKEFVEAHPEYFKNLPRPYIVDGDWPGMRSTRKTEKVPYDLYDESFPKHFTRTKCCFIMENGECLLQRVATDLQLHPWKIKPAGCWSFPIKWKDGKHPEHPTTDKEKDPHYVDESYPGYVSFLPCVREEKDGISWLDKYKYEIEYYRYVNKKK